MSIREEMVKKWYEDGGETQLRYNYKLSENSNVLDLGGYDGEWSQKIYNLYKCNIEIFEPVDSLYEKCLKKFENNNKIRLHKNGVSDRNHIARITNNGDASSIKTSSDNFQEIDVISINDILKNNIDLLKINVEGCEYEILENIIFNNKQTMILNFQIQFHDFDFLSNPISRRDGIREKLAKTHHLTYDYPFIWENWEIN